MGRSLTFPRFHGLLYKEEHDEIGGTNDHQDETGASWLGYLDRDFKRPHAQHSYKIDSQKD